MRQTTFALAMTVFLAACGAPGETRELGATDDNEQSAVPQSSFTVSLTAATTPENVVPRIVAAGRAQIAAACAANPDVTQVRVYNPLANGESADFSCAAFRDERMAKELSFKDAIDGPIGTSQQGLFSPFGIGCGLFLFGIGAFFNHVVCAVPKAENPEMCRIVSEVGFGGLGIACAFAF